MGYKNYLAILFVLTFIGIVFSNPVSTFNTRDVPVFKCAFDSSAGNLCTFSDIQLTLTDYQWQPTADEPLRVQQVEFATSVIPVITDNICKTFPYLFDIYLRQLGVQEVAENAFDGCAFLTHLWLDQNQLKKIHPNTFSSLKGLRSLYIYMNQLTELDEALFSQLENLEVLSLHHNNLTSFSPELVRYNQKLKELWMVSNDLPDLHVEKIVEYCPYLTQLYWNDNEVSCVRAVEANNFLISRGMGYYVETIAKVRHYEIQLVFETFQCDPDPSFMAATYRKEYYTAHKKLPAVDSRMKTMEDKLTKIEAMLEKLMVEKNL